MIRNSQSLTDDIENQSVASSGKTNAGGHILPQLSRKGRNSVRDDKKPADTLSGD